MNLLLDSNVEALAFNYFNFGLVTILNNLWTCLALITALSFWKIRSSGGPKPKSLDPVSIKPDQSVSVSATISLAEIKPDQSVSISAVDVTTETETPQKTLSYVCGDDVDGVRKGKFTLYYEEDMQCGSYESGSDYYDRLLPVAEGWEPEDEGEWWKCWEKVLKLRNGEYENGWYTCQDLTELNGNVVKIWDGGLRFVGSCITNESW